MDAKWAALTMVIGVAATFFERIWSGRGVGARTIQILGACMIVPLIFILALEKTFDAPTIAALIGATIGYLLGGVAEKDTPAQSPVAGQGR